MFVLCVFVTYRQGGGEEGSDPQQQTPVSGSDTEQAAAGMMSLLVSADATSCAGGITNWQLMVLGPDRTM